MLEQRQFNRACIMARDVLGLADRYDASVTSWIRTKRRNELVKGHPESKHLIALAFDLVCDSDQNIPLVIAAAQALGYIAINEGTHIHIQARHETA